MKLKIKILSILISLLFAFCNTNKTIAKIETKKEVLKVDHDDIVKIPYFVYPTIFNDSIQTLSYYLDNDKKTYFKESEYIDINHDKKHQLIELQCKKPFDKTIIIKVFSIKNTSIYENIIVNYKEKIKLINSSLKVDSVNNKLFIDYQAIKTIGSIKNNNEIKILNAKYLNEFINETKNNLISYIESKIRKDIQDISIVFKHNIFGFDDLSCFNLFNDNENEVFSNIVDEVSYSYYDYQLDGIIEKKEEYKLSHCYPNIHVYYGYKKIIEVSFSLGDNIYTKEYCL